MGIQTTLVHPASGLNLASPHGGDVAARTDLYRRFADRITVNPAFTRRVVSYQDNKETPGLQGANSESVDLIFQSVAFVPDRLYDGLQVA